MATSVAQRIPPPRWIVKTDDFGPRWRSHPVRVQSREDLDDELRTWLQESHDTVGVQDDLVASWRSRSAGTGRKVRKA
jgi:hypothetical protein